MNRTSSVIAAFDAGKLPSTQRFDRFVDWLSDAGLTNIQPAAQGDLSSRGRVLADDVRRILDAYKQFLKNKNPDNILQEAIWHLEEGDLTVTADVEEGRDQALQDIRSLRRALRTIVKVAYNNATTEGSQLFSDFASVARLILADAAEAIEERAGMAKASLRSVEREVQEGKRDVLGRDKERLEAEKDIKVKWEHGMDTVKDAGSTVIGVTRSAASTVSEKSDRTTTRLQNAFYAICDRAQSDPDYRASLDTIFGIIQARLDQGLGAISDPNVTLWSFVEDPTPEQHVPKALEYLKVFLERVANMSFDPLIEKFRSTVGMIAKNPNLKAWFDESITELRKDLKEPGYVRSEEAERRRKELYIRWRTFLEEDQQWKVNVDNLKQEFAEIDKRLMEDRDLVRIKDAHKKFNHDIEQGLIETSREAETGLQAAMEKVTWFWQDLFKYYVPHLLCKVKDIPIPRIEYKDSDMEFVLENLDISSFHLLPSHIYVRNITDVDIQTSAEPSEQSRTAIGALTHIKAQAVQLTLNDVSFWYKDKRASVGPAEFTGLLHFNLPEKGVDLDLKLRLIPATVKGPHSRENMKHFNVVEKVEVKLAEDIGMEVKESNHPLILTLFKPVMLMRLREALERTLTEQLRAAVEWTDGVAFDVAKRKEVFEDSGLGKGGSLLAAIWSEAGRIRREGRERKEVGIRATGTGIIVEQHSEIEGKEGKERTVEFAMGAEPQILSGEKRGPMGTASTPLMARVEAMGERVGVDVGAVADVDTSGAKQTAKAVAGQTQRQAKTLVQEGRRQVRSFKKSVEEKTKLEKQRPGWQTAAFDV